jgi:predicted small secreted protein
MRIALVFLVLLLSACSNTTTGDGRRAQKIDKSYAARDACLARNAAADDISNSDPATLAHAVALACSAETEQLVMAANREGDAKVAAAIRADSEFRAKGYVLKARGQLIF